MLTPLKQPSVYHYLRRREYGVRCDPSFQRNLLPHNIAAKIFKATIVQLFGRGVPLNFSILNDICYANNEFELKYYNLKTGQKGRVCKTTELMHGNLFDIIEGKLFCTYCQPFREKYGFMCVDLEKQKVIKKVASPMPIESCLLGMTIFITVEKTIAKLNEAESHLLQWDLEGESTKTPLITPPDISYVIDKNSLETMTALRLFKSTRYLISIREQGINTFDLSDELKQTFIPWWEDFYIYSAHLKEEKLILSTSDNEGSTTSSLTIFNLHTRERKIYALQSRFDTVFFPLDDRLIITQDRAAKEPIEVRNLVTEENHLLIPEDTKNHKLECCNDKEGLFVVSSSDFIHKFFDLHSLQVVGEISLGEQHINSTFTDGQYIIRTCHNLRVFDFYDTHTRGIESTLI